MKTRKYQVVAFSFFDKHAIERKLEKESEKGWVIEKTGSFIWRYRAAEPKKRHVSLVCFPNASEFDPEPTAGQEMMMELCARDGWVCAAAWGQMMYFYNEQEVPVPIETDPVLQVQNIHKGMKKTMLPQHLLMTLLCLFQLWMNYSNYHRNPVEYLSNGAQLYMGPAWLLLMLTVSSEFIRYFVWYSRAKASAERGEFFEQRVSNFYAWIFDGIAMVFILLAALSLPGMGWGMLLWFGIIAVTLCTVRLVSGIMKRKGVSRSTNRNTTVVISVIATFAAAGLLGALFLNTNFKNDRVVGAYDLNGWKMDVYADEIPLRVENFMEVECEEWSTYADVQETALLAHASYEQNPLSNDTEIPDLVYEITDIKVRALEHLVRQAHHPEEDGIPEHYDTIDPAPWNAEKAFRLYWSTGYLNTYLLYYPGRVVEIRFTQEPTLEQSKIVGQIIAP